MVDWDFLGDWRWIADIPVWGILALLVGVAVAERTSAPLLLVGVLAVMLPVWIVRSRGSGRRKHDSTGRVRAQDSVQAFFGVLSAIAVSLFFIGEAFYGGSADFMAALAAQLAGYPLPMAWFSTIGLGAWSINTGNITSDQFVGVALLLGGLAVILKRT